MDADLEKDDSIVDQPNISRVETDNDLTALLEDRPFFVFLKQLLVLAKMKVENCSVVGWHEKVISTEVISSALYLNGYVHLYRMQYYFVCPLNWHFLKSQDQHSN